jgi:hypothetical protein
MSQTLSCSCCSPSSILLRLTFYMAFNLDMPVRKIKSYVLAGDLASGLLQRHDRFWRFGRGGGGLRDALTLCNTWVGSSSRSDQGELGDRNRGRVEVRESADLAIWNDVGLAVWNDFGLGDRFLAHVPNRDGQACNDGSKGARVHCATARCNRFILVVSELAYMIR